MAKSFHNIIADGKFEVNHQGEDRTLELPTWLQELPSTEDEAVILAWATEREILLPLMQYGIKELIIALRAVARPGDKAGKKQPWEGDNHAAQERLENWIFKPIPKPGQAAEAKAAEAEYIAVRKMARAMLSTGQEVEAIRTILTMTCEPDLVNRVMTSIEE